jgi:diguanylate cyclase (GGDEF)-like protein
VDTYNKIVRSETNRQHAATKFPLLKRLSIITLVAVIFSASTLIILFRQSQIREHKIIASSENELILSYILASLKTDLSVFMDHAKTSSIPDTHAREKIGALIVETLKVTKHNDGILKLKIYNMQGVTIYSTVESEIGGGSVHRDFLERSIRGETVANIEPRDEFYSRNGKLLEVDISQLYKPIIYDGKQRGVAEIYNNMAPLFKKIKKSSIGIGLVVFLVYALPYAFLFFYIRRADLDIAKWQNVLDQYNKEIHTKAFYDELTGLANRALLFDRLEHALTVQARNKSNGALLFLDLDNFKSLNDSHGHAAGDLLLVECAKRIASCVRNVDTAARFGGDEFVVLLEELDADQDKSYALARNIAEKIRLALAEKYTLNIHDGESTKAPITHQCTSSIGVACFKHSTTSAEDILKHADIAMYQSKKAGRNQITFYQA